MSVVSVDRVTVMILLVFSPHSVQLCVQIAEGLVKKTQQLQHRHARWMTVYHRSQIYGSVGFRRQKQAESVHMLCSADVQARVRAREEGRGRATA